ncbi:MAG: DNA strand exchange inhibitor protein, partial [Phycisphaerae bacterium]
KVVPIDIRLGDDFDLLVITGPNTGGKTVALKTLGLLTLMTQAGIPIPVGPGPRTPIFNNVFVDIGDEQSIEQSLSTFSSHLSNLLDILKRADRDSLVLIDELGAGTDPDEGAAIGRAIMQELLKIGASGCITTHLSALKAVAYTEPRVDNACVEFDPQTLKPLYRLRIGEPGNSNALVIAQRLGMGHKMIERARSHLDARHQALTRAIAGTLESRRQAENARRDAVDARLEAEKQSLEHQKQARALNEARQAHQRWVDWINHLSEGDEVFVRSFERLGTIVRMQFHKQTAIVAAGPVDLEVRLQELIPPDAPDAES